MAQEVKTKRKKALSTSTKKKVVRSTARVKDTGKKSPSNKPPPKKVIQPEILEPEVLDQKDEVLPEPEDSDLDVETLEDGEPSAAEAALVSADPISRYLSELRKYPLLTREQERELAIRYYEDKDPKAAEVLVTSNLRFVVKIAAEYTKFGAKLIDLVQEGNVGLMHAVREFNPYKGVRLITYAVWWIRGYIQEYLMRQYSLVRIGTTATQRKLFYQLQRQKQELDRMGPDQAVALLSGKLGVDESDVRMMQQRLSGRDISLDKPLSDDNPENTLMAFQSNSAQESIDEQLGGYEEVHILQERIAQLRPTLSDKEQIILDQRLLADEPATLQEIGDTFGITREAVRQVEARLIDKIRKELPDLIATPRED